MPGPMAIVLAMLATSTAAAQSPIASDDLWKRDRLTGSWGGAGTSLENAGVSLGLQEQTEFWGNAAGGLTRGGAADGLLTASIAVDLEKAVKWSGASLFASGFQIHGLGPTTLLVGNLQTVSGIGATPSAKLYNLWFEQQLLAWIPHGG